jgi:hypothetical protein
MKLLSVFTSLPRLLSQLVVPLALTGILCTSACQLRDAEDSGTATTSAAVPTPSERDLGGVEPTPSPSPRVALNAENWIEISYDTGLSTRSGTREEPIIQEFDSWGHFSANWTECARDKIFGVLPLDIWNRLAQATNAIALLSDDYFAPSATLNCIPLETSAPLRRWFVGGSLSLKYHPFSRGKRMLLEMRDNGLCSTLSSRPLVEEFVQALPAALEILNHEDCRFPPR